MNDLFGTFPREFGRKRIFVKNKLELLSLIKKWNRRIDCYITIYSIKEPRAYDTAIIDKLFFDIDGKEASIWTIQLHEWLQKNDYIHIILSSGAGYHCYVECELTELKNKKITIKNAQEFIIREAKIEGKVDRHVIGDIARIARIPNTLNIKRNKYCKYCLYYEERIPKRKFDLKPFDTEKPMFENFYDDKPFNISEAPKDLQIYLKILPLFVKTLLTTTRCGWRDRYYTILGIKEVGLPIEICKMICKHYWTPEKYKHCVNDERQLSYIYNRHDLFFPLWDTIKAEGYYISEEDYKFQFYKKE